MGHVEDHGEAAEPESGSGETTTSEQSTAEDSGRATSRNPDRSTSASSTVASPSRSARTRRTASGAAGDSSQFVGYEPGPSGDALQARYDLDLADSGQARTVQRLESEFGTEQVQRWASEGMRVETMGKPRDLQAFRERQESRSPEIPDDIERRTARSVRRNAEGTVDEGAAGRTGAPDIVRRVVASPGRSLDETVQREMEGRVGGSFEDVQVHTGPRAAAAADALQARAFTVGNHVAFNRGEYRPETTEGKGVLAHELTHVRQQTGGAVSLLPQDDANHPGTGGDSEPRTGRRLGAEMHVQPKLEVSSPDDPAEKEAEAVADAVVDMERSASDERGSPMDASGSGADARGSGADKSKQRPDDTEVSPVDADRSAGSGSVDAGTESTVRSGVQGGGKPLPSDTKASFESKMGADFSDVQVHTDPTANEAASSINAEAYTMGSDIAFGSGNYNPKSTDGKELLAHELTHVVQSGSADRSVDETAAPRVQRAFGAVSTTHRVANRAAESEGGTEYKRYTVVKGDTLSEIAQAHGVEGGWPALWQENNTSEKNPQNPITDPHHIEPGWVVKVPISDAEGESEGGQTTEEVPEETPGAAPPPDQELNTGDEEPDEIFDFDLGEIEDLEDLKQWFVTTLTEVKNRAEAMGRLSVKGQVKITCPKLPVVWVGVELAGEIGGHDTWGAQIEEGISVSIEDPFDIVEAIEVGGSYGLDIQGESIDSFGDLLMVSTYEVVDTALDMALGTSEFVGAAAGKIGDSLLSGAEGADYWTDILTRYARQQVQEGAQAADALGQELGDEMGQTADEAVQTLEVNNRIADQTLTALNENLSRTVRSWADDAQQRVSSIAQQASGVAEAANQRVSAEVRAASDRASDWAVRRFESMGLGGVGQRVGDAIDAGGALTDQYADRAANMVGQAADDASGWFSSGLSWLSGGADALISRADQTISNAIESGKDYLNRGLAAFGDEGAQWVREMADNIGNTIKEYGGSAVGGAEAASDEITDKMANLGESMTGFSDAEETMRQSIRGEFADSMMTEAEAEQKLEALGDEDQVSVFQKTKASTGAGVGVEGKIGLERGTEFTISGEDGEASWDPDLSQKFRVQFDVNLGHGVKVNAFQAAFEATQPIFEATEFELGFTAPIGIEINPRQLARYMGPGGVPMNELLEGTGKDQELLQKVEETGNDALDRLEGVLREHLPVVLDHLMTAEMREVVDVDQVTDFLVEDIVVSFGEEALEATIEDSIDVEIPWKPGMSEEDYEDYNEARENFEDELDTPISLFDADIGFKWVWNWDDMSLEKEDGTGKIFKSTRAQLDLQAVGFQFNYQEQIFEYDI